MKGPKFNHLKHNTQTKGEIGKATVKPQKCV